MVKRKPLLLFALLAVPCLIASNAETPEILFVVNGGENTVEPIAFLTKGGYAQVPNPCEEDQRSRLSSQLEPGRIYSLFHRGLSIGSLTVLAPRKFYPATEEPPPFYVQLDSRVALTSQREGLATNAPVGQNPRPALAQVNAAQEASAMQLARQIFAEKGVPSQAIFRTQLRSLQQRSLGGSERYLIGTYEIERADQMGLEFSLFLIARVAAKVPEYIEFWHAKTEVEGIIRLLVDHLDLDRNAVDEIVLREIYYENYSYVILARDKNKPVWREVFRTPTLGCL